MTSFSQTTKLCAKEQSQQRNKLDSRVLIHFSTSSSCHGYILSDTRVELQQTDRYCDQKDTTTTCTKESKTICQTKAQNIQLWSRLDFFRLKRRGLEDSGQLIQCPYRTATVQTLPVIERTGSSVSKRIRGRMTFKAFG